MKKPAGQGKLTSQNTLASSWAIWTMSCAFLVAYHWAAGIASHAYESSLVLEPGRSIDIRVASLFGHAIEAELIFQRKGSDRRANVLGEWKTRASDGGALVFPDPGKQVALTVSVNSEDVARLEAMPASGFGTGVVMRRLSENGPANRHLWSPPLHPIRMRATPGSNDVVFTVADVDPELMGEKVTVLIQPPFGMMGAQKGYFILIALWPVYAIGGLALAIWTAFLIRSTWRTCRHS
ncbi:hypothetical protein [Paraburkholderia phosphatilytica]|uniref:hypothetical protein n=1 Tax=Paraburkholderia phosphatilytica TaxID=2282883 RepID=UPI000F5EAAEF|nr:hypothetical protein [Paraburkholderia phosphatilytica]